MILDGLARLRGTSMVLHLLLGMLHWVVLHVHRRPKANVTVPCDRLVLTDDSILGETFLLHSMLVLVESSDLRSRMIRAVLLDGPGVGELLLACDAGDQRVLDVVELLVSHQIVLVQLLFDPSHVTLVFHRLATLDLLVQLLFVHLNGLSLSVLPPRIDLVIEHVHFLSLICFVLPSSQVHGLLLPPVGVQLIEELMLVLALHSRVVVVGYLRTLVQDVLTDLLLVRRIELLL